MLRTEDLSYYVKHRIGDKEYIVKLVDSIDLFLDEGKVTVVYGDRYSGKYFLTRLITGLIQPSKGRVLYKDLDLTTLDKKELMSIRRKVQTYFMDPLNVFGLKSIGQHLEWLSNVFRSDGFEWIFKEFLSNYGVEMSDSSVKARELPIHKLYLIYVSSGLLAKPEILILENPSALIDYSQRNIIYRFIRELKERFGLTILVTTSDLDLVKSVGDYVYIMFRGRIIEEGSLNDVIKKPLHPYTMKLFNKESIHDIADIRVLGGESLSIYNWGVCPYSYECPSYSESCNVDVPLFECGDRRVRCVLYSGKQM